MHNMLKQTLTDGAPRRLKTSVLVLSCALVVAVGLSGCSSQAAEADPDDSAVLKQLEALRLAAAPFHSFDVAVAAGWGAAISDCVESPAGGMGIHFANLDQLGNGGKLSLLRPEVLVYVPSEDGSMEFVAVEYIIPEADWTEPEPPVFLGQELHFIPGPDIWALHVWVGRTNPAGIFADWNPDVNCEFDA